MPRYVALLRSVNVAGHGRIAMQDLRSSFEALGYTGVTSYIQTGNVLFSTGSKSEGGIAAAIEQRLAEDFGDSPAVLLRTVGDFVRIGAVEPLRQGGGRPVPPPRDVPGDRPFAGGPGRAGSPTERARRTGRRRQGGLRAHARRVRETKYTGTFLERRFGVVSTTRNWNTVTKLAGLAGLTRAAP